MMNRLYKSVRFMPCYFQTLRFTSRTVLGIESSCDDTSAAVVDENGNILGEGHRSQMKVHLENGGIIPHIAKYLHSQNIHGVVSSALNESKLSLEDISAIAVTVKPGIKGSLFVGVEYGKQLAINANKPLIPIHHMEAHALTVRMVEDVKFPFLVMLASGGHCQIAVVKKVDEFHLLGTSLHNSPGEVIDKIARQLKLQNLPACYHVSGGQAIELMAKEGDPLAYDFPLIMTDRRDCNFSFSGFSSFAIPTIKREEIKYDVAPDGIIPNVKDFCASLQYGVARHLVHRLARAMIYCNKNNILSENHRTLVFSGGVACNNFLRNALKGLCLAMGYKFACPPPKLCTDNGIMIAWNGMEKLKEGVGVATDLESVIPDASCPLGVDMTNKVIKESIKVRSPKFKIKDQQFEFAAIDS